MTPIQIQISIWPVGNMFQCKIDKIFSDMQNVFGIADDILVIGYDGNGTDHDAMVHKVLQRCEEVNLKLNKEKCHFRCTIHPFLWRSDIEKRGTTTPTKNQSPHGHATTKQQKRAPRILGHY